MVKKLLTKEAIGFISFMRKQGVVGLATGLALGLAATKLVQEIVNGLVSPVVGFILAGVDLSELVWETGLTRRGEELVIGWGAIANGLIFLLATALVIYYLVYKLRLDKLDSNDNK